MWRYSERKILSWSQVISALILVMCIEVANRACEFGSAGKPVSSDYILIAIVFNPVESETEATTAPAMFI